MKYLNKRHLAGAAVVLILLFFFVARMPVVQEWYRTVTVQGRVTTLLLNVDARVNGLLLENGTQVQLAASDAEALVSRVKVGDTVSVTGRGGRRSSFGQLVRAKHLTVNSQTITMIDAPLHDPLRGPPVGRGLRRGGPPPRGARGTPPRPDGTTPLPRPPDGLPGASPARPAVDSGVIDAPVAPAPAEPAAPPAPATSRGTVQAFLVGDRGEIVGLLLDSGEQVPVDPRVGRAVANGTPGPHPEVVVAGEARRGQYGTIIRPAQLTVGTRTFLMR